MRLIVSLHAAKAGGTSFGRHLLDHVASHVPVFFQYGPAHPQHGLHLGGDTSHREAVVGHDSFDQVIEAHHDAPLLVVHGHLRTIQLDRYRDLNPELIIWLREPIERIRSHFDYWRVVAKQTGPATQQLFAAVKDGSCTIDQFGTDAHVANYYQWILGSTAVHDLAEVGLLEHPTASLARMNALLGFAGSEEMPNINQTEGNADRVPLNPQARDAIAAANQADIEIYQQAVARVRPAPIN